MSLKLINFKQRWGLTREIGGLERVENVKRACLSFRCGSFLIINLPIANFRYCETSQSSFLSFHCRKRIFAEAKPVSHRILGKVRMGINSLKLSLQFLFLRDLC